MENLNTIEECKRSKSARKIRFLDNKKNIKIRPVTSHPLKPSYRLKYSLFSYLILHRSALKQRNEKKLNSTIKNITEQTRGESAKSITFSRSRLSSRNTQRSIINKGISKPMKFLIDSVLKLAKIKQHLRNQKRPNTRNENRENISNKNTFTVISNFDTNISAYKSTQMNRGNLVIYFYI